MSTYGTPSSEGCCCAANDCCRGSGTPHALWLIRLVYGGLVAALFGLLCMPAVGTAQPTVKVYDDYEDGLQDGEYFQFGPAPPAQSISNDTPSENGGSNALAAEFSSNTDGGFIGGFGKNDVNLDLESFVEPRLNLYYKFDAASPETAFTLEVNVQEDENGDGEYDSADDDEFRMLIRIDGSHGYRPASAEVESLLLNQNGQPGGDGQFNGTVAGIVFSINNATPDDGSGNAEGGTLLLDYISFTDGAPVDSTPPGAVTMYDDYEDGLQDGEYFQFGPAPPARSISNDTPEEGGSNALSAEFAPTEEGGFVGGFGKNDINADVTDATAPRLNFHYKFNAESENTAFVLEANVQEDENGDGEYDSADDDEFRMRIQVVGSHGYRLASKPIDALPRNQNGQVGGDGEFNGTVAGVVFSINNATPDDSTGAPEGGALLLDNVSFTGGGPLPVELAGFTVRADGEDALVAWQTLSETRNARFDVQVASGTSGAFRTVGSVRGAGTTAERQRYQYRVADLAPGVHRVRLRQVDMDGTSKLLEPKTFRMGLEGAFTVVQHAANPIHHGTTATLRYAVRDRQPLRVELYNVLGRRVRVLRDGWATPGAVTTLRIPTAALASGRYFVRFTGRTFSRTQSVTVVQ